MKILIVSPDIEESSNRGIDFIGKSIIRSLREQGHEVGLLVGYPRGSTFERSKSIDKKIDTLRLQHYLLEGRKSFKYIIKGGYNRFNILKAVMFGSVYATKESEIDQKLLSRKIGLLQMLDYYVQSPYFYQFLTRNYNRICRKAIKRVVRKHDIDMVLTVSPTVIRKKDVGSRVKLVQFVHDVMPIELVETPPDNNTPSRFAAQIFNTANYSDLVLVNSKDTKSKVTELNPDANVSVLYGAPSSLPEEIHETSILQDKNLKPNNFLLFTSTIEKRKNLETLFDAYALVYDRIHMPLVLVGAPGYGFDDIYEKYESLSPHIQENILFTGYISENDKYTLFDNAFAFVFPSIYEGFGLIIVEALQSGLPTITTRAGALPEAGGDGVLYVENPYNANEIAEAIMKLYKEPKLRDKLVKKGQKYVSKYTATKFENRLKKALESIGVK